MRTDIAQAPWEIYRIALPIDELTDASRIVDTYTKGGDIGQYSTAFGLVPDYEIGWSVMAAGEAPGDQKNAARQMLVDVFVSAPIPRLGILLTGSVQRHGSSYEGPSSIYVPRHLQITRPQLFRHSSG